MPSFFSFTFANLIVTAMSLPLVPFLLLGRTFSPHSNLHFMYVDPEDTTRVAPPAKLQDAVTLASDSLKALQVSAALQFYIDTIIEAMLISLTPGLPPPSHVQQWRTWLHDQRIDMIFSTYLNLTRWGWINKEENRVGFTLSILTDLAELTDKTRDGYPLTVEYFRFCFVITVLHELTHLLTKFAFPNAIMPIVPGTILSFGEAGEAFELQMLGGRLVCEWDKEHVTDFKHLRNLYLHRDGVDYPIDEGDIATFLAKIRNPATNSRYAINITHKTPSTLLADRVRTASQRDRERAYHIYVKKAPFPADARAKVADNRSLAAAEVERMVSGDGPKLVRTGPMLGRGKCYDQGPVS